MLATGKWIEKRMPVAKIPPYLNKWAHKNFYVSQLIRNSLLITILTNSVMNCQRIVVLSKIKWFLPLEQRKAFYNAMIKQTMLYVSNVWSACSTGNLQRVFRLQKRSAHIILDAETRANSDELFTRLDWLPLHLVVKVNICVQVHKRMNGRSPGYMSDLLVLNSDINEPNNRNDSLNLVCPRFKREIEGGGDRDIHLVWGQ